MNTTLKKSRVAVIGAGISGVLAGAHLRRAGVDVVVFERSAAAGGVWLYDERTPAEPAYPSIKPSVVEYFQADTTPSTQPDHDQFRLLKLAPPGPCYIGLRNNVPTPLMRTKLNPWPVGTEDIVSHATINAYVQKLSSISGVDSLTLYNTSVEHVQKHENVWKVQTVTVAEQNGTTFDGNSIRKDWVFDAVVVATGHYHACNVPDICNLASIKKLFPKRIMHSKGYRRPEEFLGQNVLLIGAGVSSTDIARELGPITGSIYQSSRGGQWDLTPELLPENGHRIGEIKSFFQQDSRARSPKSMRDTDPMPITVELKNGDQISNIHRIIVCTGYNMSFPFLRQYHNDKADSNAVSDTVLVTDGTQMHNLHKDIFYIPDPSLAFVGVPYYTATFTLFEFQAIAVAAVFSGRAKLPGAASMRQEYGERLKQKGAGRQFHSLKGEGEEVAYASSLVDWVNQYNGYVEGELVVGHSDEWKQTKLIHLEKIRKLRDWKEKDKPVF